MSQPNRYIFRFIHQQSSRGWTVRDTISGRTMGLYESEDEAVHAALAETSRTSEYRSQQTLAPAIPLA